MTERITSGLGLEPNQDTWCRFPSRKEGQVSERASLTKVSLNIP